MRDKKGGVAETGAMGGFEAGRGVGRRAEETHRRRDDNSSGGGAAAQKSTPIYRNLAILTITHRAPPCCVIWKRRTFRAIPHLPSGAGSCRVAYYASSVFAHSNSVRRRI